MIALVSARGNGTIPLMSEDNVPQPQSTGPQPSSEWQQNPQTAPSQVGNEQAQQPVDESGSDHQASEVTWTASEFIAHHKDVRWYAVVIVVTLVLAVIVRLLTRDNISTAMVVIVGIFFCLMAARKPRTLTYTVNDDGVNIAGRLYPYTEFKSFSVMRDGPFVNIELVPMKRFMPMTSIYCSPDSEDETVDVLAQFIPYEERDYSIIDLLARRIRF
jgi:hypothetical protein